MEGKGQDRRDDNDMKGYEYEALMNALKVSVFKCLLDEDFTVIWCNGYFYESTGYTKEEYIAEFHHSVRAYFSCLGEEYQKIAAVVMEAYQNGRTGYECVSRMPHKGGSFSWIKVVGTFTDEVMDGKPVLYVVYNDITDVVEQQELSKRLEERSRMLRAALDAAERANRAKSDFLSRMSHDIRTPLNAIIGMTEIADRSLDNTEKVHGCHKKIALASQHLLGLINDVLDMSKIESGKMTMSHGMVSLPELVENVVAIMQPEIKSRNQRLVVHPANITAESVYSDVLRLRQIFLNILSNACKFTPKGGQIAFDMEELGFQDEETVLMRFTCSDTGIGMEPEFLGHIFDAFTREQDSRVDKTTGSGLGMAITKRIVDMMGGDIQVKSQIGAGTTFQVTLPFKLVEFPSEAVKLQEHRILLADDDEVVCEYASAIFQELGLDGECVNGGAAAIEKVMEARAQGKDYDIVILDWKMPDKDGLQVAREIRREVGADVPILVASAYDWSDIEEEARSMGISGFLMKPFFRSTILNGLKEYVLEKSVPQWGSVRRQPFDFIGRRFLMAEDNELNREIAVEILSATGAQIDCVYDGAQCLEKFRQSPVGYYDLILMDVQMPVMNGYTATQEIRGLPRQDAGTVGIWAMTADAFLEDVEKSKAYGMNGHFAKPLDFMRVCREFWSFLS